MAYWDLGLKHIVDVDGQLLAIDSEVIDTRGLLKRAELPGDRVLFLVRAGERFMLHAQQSLRLSHDEVLFFESRLISETELSMRLAA